VAVHGANGIWGTLSLGLFASGQFGAPTPTGADNSAASVVTGLFYGGGTNQLVGQAIGSGVVTISTFAIAMALMYLTKFTIGLRVSKEGEIEGLDLHEHGGGAYPELMGGIMSVHSTGGGGGEPRTAPVPAKAL
jgi:Amt family ammonium transporter